MQQLSAALARGLAAGAGATVIMSGVIAAGQAAGLLREPPPERIVAGVTTLVDAPPPRFSPAFQSGWLSAHLAYGSLCGALYALARRAVPVPRPPAASAGAAFGLLVWAGNYLGLLPALSLYPPPTRDTAGRQVATIAAHLVYGASLGALERRLNRR